jgi:diadenosine tetraphosphate (Ap4A) HIT family hydrolase
MTAKASRKQQPGATTMVPVTTMEELPVLNDEERARLLAELMKAEAEVGAGQSTTYESEAFKKRLLEIYRDNKR